jgi:parallel beta-helix repeat protein
MSHSPFVPFLRLVTGALLFALVSACAPARDLTSYEVVAIAPGPDFEARARTAFLQAQPGTVIEFPAGTFSFEDQLTLEASHVVVRGQGMDQTLLDFSGQVRGSEAILARGDHFRIEDLSILDPVGTGVKTEFVDGATFVRVRVEWQRGAHPDNGDYGLYPAESRNVFIHGCVVKGARDAGVYVGQSENVIVRFSEVALNVLGIEIENSINADVYGNDAHHNTAGIAFFNLPDLKDGYGARGFLNRVWQNNTPNFAAGGILASVPGGTGMIVIGLKEVELFNNWFWDNRTVNLILAAFQISTEQIQDVDYDPYVEQVYVHDNQFDPGEHDPQPLLGLAISGAFFQHGIPEIPDIVVGGWADPDKIPGFDPELRPYTAQILPDNRICLHENGDATAGHLSGYNSYEGADLGDVTPHLCQHAPRLPVLIPGASPAPDVDAGFTPEEVAALCGAPGEGVNWGATVVNCPSLADYRLFEGTDPRRDPSPGGVPYDLTTPLFSDYATKHRFLFLPPGTSASYREDGILEFPLGTIISKTFSFEDITDPSMPKDLVVETRLLIRRAEGWEGLPYVWNEAGTEALLSVPGAVVRDLQFEDPDGVSHTIDYAVPDMAQCGSCHFGSDGDVPIGPKVALLNRDFPYAGGSENQLVHLADAGLLTGAPADPTTAPRIPFWDDPGDGTLEERARGYLDANCAHCHNPDGRAGFTSLHLQWDAPLDQLYGICKRPIAAGSGAGGLLWDIDPGDPDLSIMVFRMASEQPAIMMPELSRTIAHDAGVALVADWIATLDGDCQ